MNNAITRLDPNELTPISPLLRWAGGKQRLRKKLCRFVPADFQERTYREPFLGAGSLFFALKPNRAVLSDANPQLIKCYKAVRDHPDLVREYLARHARFSCEEYYYHVRSRYNKLPWSIAQSARFIYLNRTCFNGIFRVNESGQFNVPYGRKDPPLLPPGKHLRDASSALTRVKIMATGFHTALENSAPGDFVYLDPPYPPLNGTAYFRHYTAERFGDAEQALVAKWFRKLDKLGALVMLSNADTAKVRSLYRGYRIHRLDVRRYITCKNEKHIVGELVVTNYKVQNARKSEHPS